MDSAQIRNWLAAKKFLCGEHGLIQVTTHAQRGRVVWSNIRSHIPRSTYRTVRSVEKDASRLYRSISS
jgi:hypothetical protein